MGALQTVEVAGKDRGVAPDTRPRCRQCGQPIQRRNALGLCQRTPACHKLYQAEYARRHAEHLQALRRAWHAANPDRVRMHRQRYEQKRKAAALAGTGAAEATTTSTLKLSQPVHGDAKSSCLTSQRQNGG